MNTNQATKRRRAFQVQVLWRADQGYTAEQYAYINPILELMPGITTFRFINEA